MVLKQEKKELIILKWSNIIFSLRQTLNIKYLTKPNIDSNCYLIKEEGLNIYLEDKNIYYYELELFLKKIEITKDKKVDISDLYLFIFHLIMTKYLQQIRDYLVILYE